MKLLVAWPICFVALVSQAALAQNSSPSKSVVPRATATPARVHRQVRPPIIAPTPTASAPARSTTTKPLSYSDALRRYHHERHNRNWWRQRFTTIVLVGGGYYYWDAGYWCPAWGYDPSYEYYDYDGPIYTYGNLLPDQVILNVQRALQQLGYYSGGLTGSLSSATRAAIAAYQQDVGLVVTAVVDAPTVEALGLD
jgi:hypothetical protein